MSWSACLEAWSELFAGQCLGSLQGVETIQDAVASSSSIAGKETEAERELYTGHRRLLSEQVKF